MRDRWMRSEAKPPTSAPARKREVEDARRFAIQKFAGDVVQAAEDLQRGLNSIPEASGTEPKIVTTLREGLLGVQRSFIDLLKRNGIVNEDPFGTAFDPQRHQAMSQSVSSLVHPAGTVSQTLSSAWTLNGRLLRPAMVVVARRRTPDPLETARGRRRAFAAPQTRPRKTSPKRLGSGIRPKRSDHHHEPRHPLNQEEPSS